MHGCYCIKSSIYVNCVYKYVQCRILVYMNVEPLAVFAAALWSIVVGALWYNPKAFGTIWMHEARIDPLLVAARAKKAWMFSLLGFVMSAVMAYVLAYFVVAFDVVTAFDALWLGILTWLGLIVPVVAGAYVWEGKSIQLVIINSGYWLVSIVGMIFINTFW